jgi:hypothetical protein
MAKLTLNDIINTYDTTLINGNFTAIENEFQNKVLYRNNPTGEPNGMLTNLDMNGKRILNLPKPVSGSEPLRLQDVGDLSLITDLVDDAQQSADNAALSATAAAGSATAAATSATNAATSATSASTSATNAATSATSAATSATNAANFAAALVATSTTSNTIGTGNKTFSTQAGKQFGTGQFIAVIDSANSTNWMSGQVVSYSATTLVLASQSTNGSGTIASWNIYVSGTMGAQGPAGATGATGATGPAGPNVTVLDEGVTLTTTTGTINFTGSGVTASNVGNDVTVVIPGAAAAGTVTSVSVVNANGFNGSVATATTTPAITLQTTASGVLKGSSNALVAATSGTDFSAGTSSLATGIVKTTTGTGALSIAVAGDFPTLNQNTTGTASNVTGTVAVANGGTGATTLTGYVKGNGTSAFTTVATITGSDVSGNISGNAANVTGTVLVPNGGTGATTLTGYTKGNGTSAFTASATIPVADLTGTLSVANGGTGVATLTSKGILFGNGTSAVGITSAGAAGQVLTSNGAGVDPTFQTVAGGSSGMAFLTKQTIPAAASMDFLTLFSSSYDDYLIIISGITTASSANLRLRLAVAGSAVTGGYNRAYTIWDTTGSTNSPSYESGQTSFTLNNAVGSGTAIFSQIWVRGVNSSLGVKTMVSDTWLDGSSGATVIRNFGRQTTTSVVTGFQLSASTGNLSSSNGTVTVWGFKNS